MFDPRGYTEYRVLITLNDGHQMLVDEDDDGKFIRSFDDADRASAQWIKSSNVRSTQIVKRFVSDWVCGVDLKSEQTFALKSRFNETVSF